MVWLLPILPRLGGAPALWVIEVMDPRFPGPYGPWPLGSWPIVNVVKQKHDDIRQKS